MKSETPEPEETLASAGWAGVAQVFIRALGGAAKYAVIVAGMLIALYFYIDQQNKIATAAATAREKAEELNEKKLDAADKRLQTAETQLQAAQQQLVTTYQSFQDIGSRQVNNLKDVLNLRDQVDTQIQALENSQRKDEGELAAHKAAAEKLEEQLNQKQQFILTQTAELNARQNQLDKARSAFDQKRHQLDDAERARLKQAETYNLVKDNLIDLANRVDNIDGKIDDKTKSLARTILGEAQDINERLKEFVQNPDIETLGKVIPILTGMTRDDVNKIKFNDLGINQLISLEGRENASIIVLSQSNNSYDNLLLFSFEKNILVQTRYMKMLLGIRLHAANDWNKEILAIRSISPDGNSIELTSFSGAYWTLKHVLETDIDINENVEVISNKGQPVQSLSFEEYTGLFGYDYHSALKEEKYGDAAVSLAMAARAANYVGVKVGPAAQVPSDILESLNKVGRAALETYGSEHGG